MNTQQIKALASYTEAKSTRYEQALYGLISIVEYDHWVAIHKAEIDNTLQVLSTPEKQWLDHMAE